MNRTHIDKAVNMMPQTDFNHIFGSVYIGNNHLVQMVRDYMRGRITACVKGGYDFVDVRDVAQGCLLAAEKGRTGRCYILSGEYSTIYTGAVTCLEMLIIPAPCITMTSSAGFPANKASSVSMPKQRRKRPRQF